jgi:hypothetical protein
LRWLILALFNPYCNNLIYKQIPEGKAKDAREMEQEKRGLVRPEIQYSVRDANSLEPMTGAQADHLKTLAEEVHEPDAYQQGLSRREASHRIDALREKIRICELPPHTG